MINTLKQEKNYDRAVIKLLKFRLNKLKMGTSVPKPFLDSKESTAFTHNQRGTTKTSEDLLE